MTRFGVDRFTVPAVLDARAADFGDAVVLRIDGVDVTFAQLRDRSAAAANVLLGLGVSRGDTVALFAGTTFEWVYFWLGAARIGAVSAAVNAANKGDSLRHALTLSAPKVVVTDTEERCRRLLDVAPDGVRAVLTDDAHASDFGSRAQSTQALLAAASTRLPDAVGRLDEDPDEPAVLFFTSGTTGPSKAVATSWRYLFTAAATVADAWEFDTGEVIWSAMPLFHLSAVATILAPLLVGGTTVLASSFRPSEVLEDVRSCGAVGFVGAGAMVSMLHNLPADRRDNEVGWRFISAAPIAAELYQALERRYGCRVVTMYGLTEAFPLATSSVAEGVAPGTSGRVNPAFDVAILDPAGDPASGAVGEIACRPRAPGVMSLGYVDGSGLRAHESWFRTGDLGRIDDLGQLTYVDRVKDAIRRRGENISSVEVEQIAASYPGVAEAAAVGVPSDLGEDDVLLVVSVAPGAELDQRRLLDFCADRMPYFCVPRYIRTLPELPRNAVGRVRKDLLRTAGVADDTWDRDACGYVVRR